jgi:hypothetical protein
MEKREIFMERAQDSSLARLDITSHTFVEWSSFDVLDLIESLPLQKTVRTVHLSGLHMERILTERQFRCLVLGIGRLPALQELFVFQGGCAWLTEKLLSECLQSATTLKVLILWQFSGVSLSQHHVLAGALRQHPSLQRITINIPSPVTKKERRKLSTWGCLDVYAMGLASNPNLQVVQVRVLRDNRYRQQEALISPEALQVLLQSNSMHSLYLENMGLIDDHVDALADEFTDNNKRNQVITLLDLKDNLFTDDCLYTFARALPVMDNLQSLDLSGCQLTKDGGEALAAGMKDNHVLQHLELEGDAERYADEFHIPTGHSQDPWMRAVQTQLRLNRAYAVAAGSTSSSTCAFAAKQLAVKTQPERFVEALNSVSDSLEGIYHFVRSYPQQAKRLQCHQHSKSNTSHDIP